MKNQLKILLQKILFSVFSIFPLTNTVVGSSFYGEKYENNPRYVFEKLQEKYPEIRKYWICRKRIALPKYVAPVHMKIGQIYRYATSKVIIDSHFIPMYVKKRKGQLSIFMYHGGIGIKRNSNEVPSRAKSEAPTHNANNMTFFVSNSTFTSRVIRGSLEFTGPILKCGYPKNDPLFDEQYSHKKAVCEYYHISTEKKILMYAPTYRQNISDDSKYDIDLSAACNALSERFGGQWIAIVKWHPHQRITKEKTNEKYGDQVIDVTDYYDMQELIIASDAFVSDYSSCIFEAAVRNVPCFSYATDWDTFKYEQGVYFEIEELPFPYCKNNAELIEAIYKFDIDNYTTLLGNFMEKEGLFESGTASEVLADTISNYINGHTELLDELEFEDI